MTIRTATRSVSLAAAVLLVASACAQTSTSTAPLDSSTSPDTRPPPTEPITQGTIDPSSASADADRASVGAGGAFDPDVRSAVPIDTDDTINDTEYETDDDGEEIFERAHRAALPEPPRRDHGAFDPILDVPARVGLEMHPTPTPAPVFEPVDLVDADDDPSGDGTLVGGDLVFTAATGCGDHCIEDAQISTAGGSSSLYDLVVEVESPATVDAYLSLAPIERNDDGAYVQPFSEPTVSQTVGFTFRTSFDLEPATEYHLLVRAADDQGTSQVAGSFTTAEAMGPDQLATPSACADGCLNDVTFDADRDGTGFTVGFVTTASATIDLEWSTGQFGFDDDGRPVLTDSNSTSIDAAAGATTTWSLSGLVPDTAYSVIVTATDDLGGVDRWTARVATPPPPVFASIHFLHIDGDGDDGSNNRGEIRFSYGTWSTYWGDRSEAKIASNSDVLLEGDSARHIYPDSRGNYDGVIIFAGERDGREKFACFVGASETEPKWGPGAMFTDCGTARTTWSAAFAPQMSYADLQALPGCGDLAVAYLSDRCLTIETWPNGSDEVSFSAVVAYDIG